MSEYEPDAWVIVEVSAPNIGTIRRLLCSYYGGYLGADSWRMSSGITSAKDGQHTYEVLNQSGSIYTLLKAQYRMSGFTTNVWEDMVSSIENQKDVNARLYTHEEAVAYLESVGAQHG